MTRTWIVAAAVLSVVAVSSSDASAQQPSGYPEYLSAVRYYPGANQAPAAPQAAKPRYPYLGAPMYPCPIQNVPVQVGGTMLTNQAFAPHEMMHPHEYRALYGPFYYRVKGSWWWTPFGMESHDKWELAGTEVRVKYRSKYSLLSGFKKPRNSIFKKNRR